MSSVVVSTAALRVASSTWDDQAEGLRGARKRLLDAESSVGDLGPRVGPAAQAYLDAWIDRAKSLGDQAQRHAEALSDSARGYLAADQVVGDDVAGLMPWGQRGGTGLTGTAP